MKNNYQLNPVYEWAGHIVSGLTGGIYGALKSVELNDKESFKLYREKLNDPKVLNREVAYYIMIEKKLARGYEEDIKFARQQTAKLRQSSDPLEREEAEWFADTSELEEKLAHCKWRINNVKQLLKDGDIDRLITWLFNGRTKLVDEVKKRTSERHKLRTCILTYGGIATGAVGYHYAKKALLLAIKKFMKK